MYILWERNADSRSQFLTQVPKTRTDLLPHYSRLIATLAPFMPDIVTDILAYVRRVYIVKSSVSDALVAGRGV